MKKYNGTTNLDDHIHVYLTQVSLYSIKDAILARDLSAKKVKRQTDSQLVVEKMNQEFQVKDDQLL